jgi:DNA-binding NtrC family response regulator
MEPMNVLFVDDELDFLDTLLKRMQKRQVNVCGVGNGQAALDHLESRPVDVVVLDVRMPGMDGIETLKEIKKRHPLVEVIMLTGHADMGAAIEGMEAAAFDYLMKPVDIDELLYKIQDAYQKRTIHLKKIRHMMEATGSER